MTSPRWPRCKTIALIVVASVALSGCVGAATNGGAGGGCSAGMRF
ncbi:hypothetical protein [Burkholderia ubonensis]|nr:hypothetical protein [Burkholderia ubonensis]